MKWTVMAASVAAVLIAGAGVCAPAAAADSWVGQYARHAGSYRWEATIASTAAGIYRVRLSVASQMPLCSGDASVTARLSGERLLVEDSDCSLTISRRGPNGIRIDEKECDWHGVACPFSVELRRK